MDDEKLITLPATVKQVPFTIKRSDPCDQLMAAICEVQGALTPAKRNARNPHFNADYADLEAVWDVARSHLHKHLITVLQVPMYTNGKPVLITTLFHKGQWVEGELPILSQRQDMQGLGSGLTYARRYSLATMLGVVTEDDDAEAATSRSNNQQERRKNDGEKKNQVQGKPQGQEYPNGINQNWLQRIFALATPAGWHEAQIDDFIAQKWKLKSKKLLSQAQCKELTEYIISHPIK